MIVASMNYRLGTLGFLSLPPAAPGNAGLWDQRLAMRWLRKNAAAFSGDPASFLLFGLGAGAASLSFHHLSPGSRPLFTHAALQSGAPNAPWAWISLKEAQERGQRLGHLLGCADRDDTALVGCLQGKEAGEFPKHQFSVLLHKDLLAFPFVPTPDWGFLPDTSPRLLQARHGQPMPIVAGFTANEGSYMLIYGAPNLNLENASNVGWEELLQVVRLMVPEAPELAIRAVAERYCKDGEGQGEARYRWAMDQIAGDYLFVCPVAEVASGLSTPEWTGVPHGSELPYLFGTLASVGEANHTHTEAEATMSQTMMQYCGKFAGSKDHQRDRGQWEAMAPLQPHKAELLPHRTGATPSQGDNPCPPLHVLGNTAHIEAEPYCTKRPLVHRDLHRLQGEQTQEDMPCSGGCE
ncbi:unnamed protein product [Natator depressus]